MTSEMKKKKKNTFEINTAISYYQNDTDFTVKYNVISVITYLWLTPGYSIKEAVSWDWNMENILLITLSDLITGKLLRLYL